MAERGDLDISDSLGEGADIEKKKAKITKQLKKREDERLSELAKKKSEKESTAAQNESVDFFLRNFNTEKSIIDEALQKVVSVEKSQVNAYLDDLLLSIQKMQKFLTESTIFLPTYDMQKAQEVINQLQLAVNEKREILLPKKKFAFKGKKKTSDKPTVKQDHIEKKMDIDMKITECNFSDKKSEVLVKQSDEVSQKDVALARLEDCTVKLFGSPQAIHIDKLKNCKVFSGPVSGSIFMDNCENCVFVVGCQQLRIHNTTNTSFYIHVTSKAIIEDCHDVRFAPYNLTYEGLDEHYGIAQLNRSFNNWDDVDDFNWLASDAHSPNWSVIPEDERTLEWNI